MKHTIASRWTDMPAKVHYEPESQEFYNKLYSCLSKEKYKD